MCFTAGSRQLTQVSKVTFILLQAANQLTQIKTVYQKTQHFLGALICLLVSVGAMQRSRPEIGKEICSWATDSSFNIWYTHR